MNINKDTFKEESETFQNSLNNELISLGDHCVIALYLKKYGFKHRSYPFDWIVSNLDIVSHILQDDFSTFLNNPDYYKKYITSGKMFYHNSIDNDKEYFQRCISRFYNLTHYNCTFFMSISHTGGDKITQLEKNQRMYTEQNYTNLYDILTKKYKINCKLVIIHIYLGNKSTSMQELNTNIHIYNIYGKLWGGILDNVSEKSLLNIFKNYS